jgi:hypothetical protein
MSKAAKILIAVVVILGLGALAATIMRNRAEPKVTEDQQGTVRPPDESAGMTTEAVPQYSNDGVVPAPSDAVGTYKPPQREQEDAANAEEKAR